MTLTTEEVQRKVLHFIFGTIIPVGIFYLPRYAASVTWLPDIIAPWMVPTIILGVCLVGFIALEFARFRVPAVQSLFSTLFGSMLRKKESSQVTGATYINASAFICSIVFKDYPHVAFMVLMMFIWGDAVAALVGISMGKIKIGEKSLEGSLACFFLCLFTAFVVIPLFPGLLDAWSGRMPVFTGILLSLCITGFELVPFKIGKVFDLNDNLVVPVLTGLIVINASRFLS